MAVAHSGAGLAQSSGVRVRGWKSALTGLLVRWLNVVAIAQQGAHSLAEAVPVAALGGLVQQAVGHEARVSACGDVLHGAVAPALGHTVSGPHVVPVLRQPVHQGSLRRRQPHVAQVQRRRLVPIAHHIPVGVAGLCAVGALVLN